MSINCEVSIAVVSDVKKFDIPSLRCTDNLKEKKNVNYMSETWIQEQGYGYNIAESSEQRCNTLMCYLPFLDQAQAESWHPQLFLFAEYEAEYVAKMYRQA